MIKLDTVDEKLINLLQHDALQSSQHLAAKLEVSTATVRRRIRRLLENNVIRIAAAADPTKWGLNVPAFIGLNVDTHELDKIVQILTALEPVVNILITTGGFDIITLVRVSSIEELDNLLRGKIRCIPGVRSLETFIRLKDIKIAEVIEIRRDAAFNADTLTRQKQTNVTPDKPIPSLRTLKPFSY